MPYYYFNLTNGKLALADAEGIDLPEELTIREYARNVAQDMMVKHRRDAENWDIWRIVVANEAGRPVMVVPFREVVG